MHVGNEHWEPVRTELPKLSGFQANHRKEAEPLGKILPKALSAGRTVLFLNSDLQKEALRTRKV